MILKHLHSFHAMNNMFFSHRHNAFSPSSPRSTTNSISPSAPSVSSATILPPSPRSAMRSSIPPKNYNSSTTKSSKLTTMSRYGVREVGCCL
ncbi:hypothetical protein ZOSMA_18G01010 [Zostera marina]|uniref:Uncharacterized protein n=1 Tax=Zostera marina TaxID=29655 RepID=A0A0K9PPW2_ZOSMR|nr:hypothetical protein ZOSMA_18G01010 [Zostera marina]